MPCQDPEMSRPPDAPGPFDRILSALLGYDVTKEQGGHGIGCLCDDCMKRRVEQRAQPLPPDSLGGILQELARKKRDRMN